jgi:hypothetical protein
MRSIGMAELLVLAAMNAVVWFFVIRGRQRPRVLVPEPAPAAANAFPISGVSALFADRRRPDFFFCERGSRVFGYMMWRKEGRQGVCTRRAAGHPWAEDTATQG